MSAPKWAIGMERVGTGIYVDAHNALHFDSEELCRVAGVPPTEANYQMLRKAATEIVQKLWPGISTEEVEESDERPPAPGAAL